MKLIILLLFASICNGQSPHHVKCCTKLDKITTLPEYGKPVKFYCLDCTYKYIAFNHDFYGSIDNMTWTKLDSTYIRKYNLIQALKHTQK